LPLLFWDASGLAKRYILERGSDTVDALFVAASSAQMITTVIGYAETFAALVRCRNRGTIPPPAFTAAKTALGT
jgi:hypothetical protein